MGVCGDSCDDLPWRANVQDGQIYGIWIEDPRCMFICHISSSQWSIFVLCTSSCNESNSVCFLQAITYPGKVLSLKMTKPPGFRYQSGMYVFVQCPQVSKFEWWAYHGTEALVNSWWYISFVTVLRCHFMLCKFVAWVLLLILDLFRSVFQAPIFSYLCTRWWSFEHPHQISGWLELPCVWYVPWGKTLFILWIMLQVAISIL